MPMTEQYEEYRSRRKSHDVSKKTGYAQRLGKQLVISLLCLSAVFLLNRTNSELSGKVNRQIKAALNYKIDTQKITAALDNLLPRYRTQENKVQENGDITNAQDTSEKLQDI